MTYVYSVLKLYLELFPVSFLPRGRCLGEGSPLLRVSFSVSTKPTEPPRFTLPKEKTCEVLHASTVARSRFLGSNSKASLVKLDAYKTELKLMNHLGS